MAQGLPFGTGPFIHVECDPPGADLQKKLDTAVSGSEIFIVGNCDDGPYRIHAKNLSLVASSGGDGVTMSSSDPEGSVLEITGGSSVLIRARDLQPFVIDAQGSDDGISVSNNSTVVIDGVTVEGASGSGVFAGGGSSLLIAGGAVIRDNGVGLQVVDASDVEVFEGTTIAGGDPVVQVQNNGFVLLSNAEVTGDVDVGFGSSATIDSSVLNGGSNGVNVFNGSTASIADTTISGSSLSGVRVDRTSDAAIFSSTITGNGENGVSVEWNATAQISGTVITGNGIRGVSVGRLSFVNFFDPPSTIENNGANDVNCDTRSGFAASSTQTSQSKVLVTDGSCLVLGAPLF